MLAESQERTGWATVRRTVTVSEARQFEAGVRRLDDGESLPLVVFSGQGGAVQSGHLGGGTPSP